MTTQNITSELGDNFIPFYQWAYLNLTPTQFAEFEQNYADKDNDLIQPIYENWMKDQKITHEYFNLNLNSGVSVSYKNLL